MREVRDDLPQLHGERGDDVIGVDHVTAAMANSLSPPSFTLEHDETACGYYCTQGPKYWIAIFPIQFSYFGQLQQFN
jgi:hypothetical protein